MRSYVRLRGAWVGFERAGDPSFEAEMGGSYLGAVGESGESGEGQEGVVGGLKAAELHG